jgi:DNA polymerase I-like protein with 3'-5' exonuclease and polymerase domains
MKITINTITCDFRPWRPELGQVFRTPYSFDCETTLIDDERPWISPAYVLGVAFDGDQGYFVRREHVADFFTLHRNVPVVMHNAPFDLAVINCLSSSLGIYDWVDSDLVWDTQLLHRGYMLASEGHTASGKGQSTLEHCADRYLGITLPKDVVDSRGNPVRTSYGRWLNREPGDIERIYLEYLAKDAIVTLQVFVELRRLLKESLEQAADAFGYVSPAWLAEQVRRWGWQTHHIQLKGAIVLKEITANGMNIDVVRRAELDAKLQQVADERLVELRRHGFLPEGEGSQKALQEILRREEARHPGLQLPRTATDRYVTKKDALAELADELPFVKSYVEFKEVQQLRSTFLGKMSRRVLHPSFDPFKTSGRTSSFGDLNSQNLPRDDRVRSCFVPSPAHVFIDADYNTVELATLGQAIITQFGRASKMAESINDGKDLHKLVAARVTGKPEFEVTKADRQKAKVMNFGKPGGMGSKTLQRYAKASYGVDLDFWEITQLEAAWLNLFPEMNDFLGDDGDLGEDVAHHFGLTPQAICNHTQSDRYVQHPDVAGHEDEPSAPLGWMCWKTLGEDQPTTKTGRPYDVGEMDFFWTQVEKRISDFPTKYHAMIRSRTPSKDLRGAAAWVAERGSCITATGRLRSKVGYCQRHNTLFQGLAADGAKLALWLLWRAGYRIVNFVHDEVLIEVPAGSNLKFHAETIRELMIAGMQMVVPDVRIDVEFAVSSRWYKAAEAVYDDAGNLLPWEPSSAPSDDMPTVPIAAADFAATGCALLSA